MGYSDVSPGVRMRHLEGPKNPDGLNLDIYVFVYVYNLHMCIVHDRRRDDILDKVDCFFLEHIFSLEKEKQKI